MALQSTTATRAGRRAKSETETPVKRIALPKKTSAKANAATTATTATTKAAAPAKAAKATKAAAPIAKATKPAAPKRLKRGTEGVYEMRTGSKVQCKVTGYLEQPNGLWMTVKDASGNITKVRPVKFTSNAQSLPGCHRTRCRA